MSPSVSVIMPVYNAESWLKQSVDSILAQTFTDWELIIVNDGSTDSSAALLNSYTDPRIRVLHQANAGVSAALNKALEYCTAPFIARLDADDVSLPERLLKEVDFLNRNPKCGLVGAAAEKLDQHDNQLGFHRHPLSNMRLQYGLLWECYFVSSTVMFRRECLDKVGRFYTGTDLFDDYSMWSSIAAYYEVANLPDVLLKYRVLDTGLSHTTLNSRARLINQRRKNIAFHFPKLAPHLVEALAQSGFQRTHIPASEVKIVYKMLAAKFATGTDATGIISDLKTRFQNTFRLLTPDNHGIGYKLLRPAEKLMFNLLLRN